MISYQISCYIYVYHIQQQFWIVYRYFQVIYKCLHLINRNHRNPWRQGVACAPPKRLKPWRYRACTRACRLNVALLSLGSLGGSSNDMEYIWVRVKIQGPEQGPGPHPFHTPVPYLRSIPVWRIRSIPLFHTSDPYIIIYLCTFEHVQSDFTCVCKYFNTLYMHEYIPARLRLLCPSAVIVLASLCYACGCYLVCWCAWLLLAGSLRMDCLWPALPLNLWQVCACTTDICFPLWHSCGVW